MSSDRLISFFRMTRESFDALARILESDPIFQNDSRNRQGSIVIHLATTLYFLGSFGISTVRGVAQLGIAEGTSCLYRNCCIMALVRLLPRFVQWPIAGSSQYRTMRLAIEARTEFPGCMRFLDGTDITLQYSPSYFGETYFNRKKKYALSIQAICNEDRRFTYISTGYPGSVSDTTMFCESSFFQHPNLFFWRPEEYILADKVYRVTRRCMTPYKEPWASLEAGGYRRFNLYLAEARVKVEHAFGVSKNRWRSLQGLPIHICGKRDHAKAIEWIMACIVLHNFLVENENDEIWQLEEEELQAQRREEQDFGVQEVDEPLGLESERLAGTEWRNRMHTHFDLP